MEDSVSQGGDGDIFNSRSSLQTTRCTDSSLLKDGFDLKQEFYVPHVPASLVVLPIEASVDLQDLKVKSSRRVFDKSNMLSQNFLGICYDEISNCIRDRYGFDVYSEHYTIREYLVFAEKYEKITIDQTIKWEALMTHSYPDLPLPSLSVRDAVRKGIPNSLRGKCWFYYSGAHYHYSSNPKLYMNLLTELSICNPENLDVIDKDITRTFPDNVLFHRESQDIENQIRNEEYPEILNKIRRILIAFSIYRPEVGYCQGMNFIVGLSLLFMSEECVFWLLATIVDHVMPLDIYSKDLLGTSIDQDIFKLLLKLKYPKLYTLMENHDVPLTLITCEWFMTLFVNALPIESVLRVWDAFFYEGTKVLFRISLAIFHMNEKEISKAADQEQLMTLLKRLPKRALDCEALIQIAFEAVGPLRMAAIDRKREHMRLKRFNEKAVSLDSNKLE
jgi:hypothetical protein